MTLVPFGSIMARLVKKIPRTRGVGFGRVSKSGPPRPPPSRPRGTGLKVPSIRLARREYPRRCCLSIGLEIVAADDGHGVGEREGLAERSRQDVAVGVARHRQIQRV